jgi:hypothetical protein
LGLYFEIFEFYPFLKFKKTFGDFLDEAKPFSEKILQKSQNTSPTLCRKFCTLRSHKKRRRRENKGVAPHFSILLHSGDFVNRQIAQTCTHSHPKICAICLLKNSQSLLNI